MVILRQFSRFKLISGCLFLITSYGSVFSQEYTYDANGNLSADANKQIASIHYNILNLADTITYTDGRKIIYSYTASGQKLRQQVVNANGSLKQKRDYVNNFLYRNDTLQEIGHDVGRVVPTLAGYDASSWEYQYHLTDHLGDVRSTITSQIDTVFYNGTMESTNALSEESRFAGLRERRVTQVSANHTANGHEVVRLLNNTPDGLSMNLAVTNGDVIYLKVYAYYEGATIENDPVSTIVPIILSALSGGLSGIGESQGNLFSGGNNLGGAVTSASGTNDIPPIAHLNYQLFDKEYKLIDGGFKAVSENASFNKELLVLGPIRINRSGYVRVFLSNTSLENRAVYFDDLEVEHIKSPVIQEDSYYPFGLAIAEQHDERFGEEANRHLYNGKELQDDFDLNWSDYGARMYDAALGRWHVIDPMAEKYANWSPYNYTMNDPIKFVDPNGKDVTIFYSDNKGVERRFIFDGSDASRKRAPKNEFVKQFIEAYDYNNKNGGGENLREMVTNHDYKVYVDKGYEDMEDGYTPLMQIIVWSPDLAMLTDGVIVSPATLLEHEAAHALDAQIALKEGRFNEFYEEMDVWDNEISGPKSERVTMEAERRTALANGEIVPGMVPRLYYSPNSNERKYRPAHVRVYGPTSTRPVTDDAGGTEYHGCMMSRFPDLLPDEL